MRFTDLLTNQDPQQYTADGKNYTFIPGKNGSLTALAPPKPSLQQQIQQQNPVKSKVIMPTDVGSSRG